MDGLNSNLNLNADAPPRVRPRMGEWGPVDVPATKRKKRVRWLTALAFVGVLTVVFLYGWWILTMMRG